VLIFMCDDCTWAKICYALAFKGHSLGGSSILVASLYVSKTCIVAFAHAGRATRFALPRFLVKS